jgi:hypothetical protein
MKLEKDLRFVYYLALSLAVSDTLLAVVLFVQGAWLMGVASIIWVVNCWLWMRGTQTSQRSRDIGRQETEKLIQHLDHQRHMQPYQ